MVTGLQMMRRGKPGFLPHKIQNVAAIRRIYERTKLQKSRGNANCRLPIADCRLEGKRPSEVGNRESGIGNRKST